MKNKHLWLRLLAFILSLPTLAFMQTSKTNAVTEFPDIVHIGDQVNFPIRILEKDGSKKVANLRVISPTGIIYKESGFVVTEPGVYTAEYFNLFAGEEYVEKENFTCVRYSSDMFVFDQNSTGNSQATNDFFKYAAANTGVKLALKNNDVAHFTAAIDLRDFDKNRVLADLIVEPSAAQANDMEHLYLVLTDEDDASNYLKICIENGGAENGGGRISYIRAGGPTQILSGEEFTNFHNDGMFGCPAQMTFRGLTEEQINARDYTSLKLYYDLEENALYADQSADWRTPGKARVCDFDDPNLFPTNPWSGFTSGRVRLSLYADGIASNANVMIYSLGGFDLTKEEQEDHCAPRIIIDQQGQTTMPTAVLGSEFPIFKAVGYDDYDAVLDVNVEAFYLDPHSGEGLSLAIDNHKVFIPYLGTYKLVYTCADLSKNTSVEERYFTSVTATEALKINVPPISENPILFQEYLIPSTAEVTTSGGSGNVVLERHLFSPSNQEVMVKNNGFTPDEVGNYRLVFSAFDFLGNHASKEILLPVTKVNQPVFLGQVVIPPAMLKGFTYDLPNFTAKEVDANNQIINVPVKKYVDGVLTTDEKLIANGETMVIKYVASGVSGTTEFTKNVVVLDGENGRNTAKYFYSENAVITEEKENIKFTYDADSEVTFINPLSSVGFDVKFHYAFSELNVAGFALKLLDTENGKTVTVDFSINSSGVKAKLPGSKVWTAVNAVDGDLEIIYDHISYALKDIRGNIFGILTQYDDGTAFNGLSKAIYMSTRFVEVWGASTLYVATLNSQPFGHGGFPSSSSDLIEPSLVLDGEFATRQPLGATLTLPKAEAYDVLNETNEVTVQVISGGQNILPISSAKEEHTITLDQLQKYTVIYRCSDTQGNEYVYTRMISVVEYEKPILTVDLSKISSNYQLKDTIKLPTASATDNTGKVTIDVLLIDPDNEVHVLKRIINGEETNYMLGLGPEIAKDANTIILSKIGRYTLRYLAYDENYNFVAREAIFTVRSK